MTIKLDKLMKQKDNLLVSLMKIDNTMVLFTIISFFYGRALIFEIQNPFFLAINVAAIFSGVNYVFICIFSLIGLITTGNDALFMRYLASILMFIGTYSICQRSMKHPQVGCMILGSISSFIPGYFFIYTKDYLLFDFIMVVTEALITGGLIYIFSIATRFIKKRGRRKLVSNEEIIASSILIAFSILGADIIILGVSLANLIALCIIVLLVYYSNESSAVIGALLLGFIVFLGGSIEPETIVIYAIAALLASMLRNWGKLICILSFFCMSIMLSLYIGGTNGSILGVVEIAVIGILFLFLPKRYDATIEKYLSFSSDSVDKDKVYEHRLQEYAVSSLMNTSNVFSDLSNSVKHFEEIERSISSECMDEMIENVFDDVCVYCMDCNQCWKENMKATYDNLKSVIKGLEQNDIVNIEKQCRKPKEVYEKLGKQYEKTRVSMEHQSQMQEIRKSMWAQMGEVSSIVKKLAFRVGHNLDFDRDMEKAIIVALDAKELFVKDVAVAYIAGSYEVTIIMENHVVDKAEIEEINNIVNKASKRKFSATMKNRSLHLTEKRKYQLAFGVASRCKEGNTVNGDTYGFCELQDGKYAILISDGMGSGEKAAEQSEMTIKLLEKLLIADFDKVAAIKALNDFLLFNTLEESYATVDLGIINQHNGELHFAKLGSSDSYIKSGEHVEVIKSSSLPIGIIENIDMESKLTKVRDGDMLIMITDGIVDGDKNNMENNQWLLDLISQSTTRNPQSLADTIIKAAIIRSQNIILDDMTVIVTKIW